ncbi:MAG: PBP1A family penicillin-binding protein [Lactobacillus sp.]|nr:PBP1A family penicillin-binding protein [Lactobacillus sp.]
MNEVNNTPQRRRRVKKDEPWKRYLSHAIKWGLMLILILIVSGIGVFAYYAKDAPEISQSQLQSGGTSSLYTKDGSFLMSLGSENRIYVKSKEIPQVLKDAIVSVEDKRFYSNKLGVDPIRIIGSMVTNARSSSIAAGGSTITQQLVKLTVFSTANSQRTIKRKAQEAWLAMKVARDYSKEQILEFYINKVYMNYGNYGMGTASKYYYGKSLDKLDLAQTALIAGMPNAPVSYDPYLYPKTAKWRRDIVLRAMYQNGKITKKQMNAALKENIKKGLVKQQNKSESTLRKIDDPYIKEVINEVQSKGFDPYNDNLKITVNIDQAAQKKLYQLANNGTVPFTNNKMQIGSAIVDPSNGDVVAIIGGRKLPSVQLGLDRAVQTSRSTGSSIKPLLDYGPAIEYLHWSTAKMLNDSKYVYPGTNIQLYDWDNTYPGWMTMRYALEQSRNVPAVKTLQKVGLTRASAFVKKMGIKIDKNAGLSVAIGANASALQMAAGFAAISNGGIYYKPHFVSKIESLDGITRNYSSDGVRVMNKSTAYMLTDMLKGVLTRGSGTTAKINNLHEAGKTGTVKYSDQDLKTYPAYANTPKDSWFVGYTKKYSMGIWTGFDNLKDGTISGQGQYAAQLMYKNMMSYLMQGKTNSDWTKPSTVIRARVVKNSRPIRLAYSGNNWELFVKGYAPAGATDGTPSYDDSDAAATSSSTNTTRKSVTTTKKKKSTESSEAGSTKQSDKKSSNDDDNKDQDTNTDTNKDNGKTENQDQDKDKGKNDQ